MEIDIKKPDPVKDETVPTENVGKTILQWKFPEYEEHVRGFVWYIVTGIISISLLIYAIIVSNFLFAIIIVIVDLIILIQINRKPDLIDFKITDEGVVIGTSFTPYKNISNFWIIYNPPKVKTLYINYKATIRPDITIPLENKNPLRVREVLLQYIEEDLEKEEESNSEQIRKFLKL
ncbi:hypothetical protein KKB10_05860 [Patescibacteria group bacterium]|nr:hypothetical protein [Patescibacteria group bacterium]MBU1074819.1 hypothetical protein [Patescibacteria group bacterium]MBU1951666.1 hypothetical protein [Patescibacteria group bacterium]